MQIYDSAEVLDNISPTVVAIGLFDGLHMGHMAVISKALEISEKKGLTCAILTFDITPQSRPSAKTANDRIMTPACFAAELAAMGVDVLVHPDFADVRDMSPDEFARTVLSAKLNAKAVCCGENFRFGKGAAGTAAELYNLGQKYAFDFYTEPVVFYKNEAVSSTRVRACIKNGDIAEANKMLTRPYSIDFKPDLFDGNLIVQSYPQGYCVPKPGKYKSVVTAGPCKINTKTIIQHGEAVTAKTIVRNIDEYSQAGTVKVQII